MQLFLICMFFTITSCSEKTTPPEKTTAPDKITGPGAFFATVVDYSELDGCTYLLELADGQKLQPINLPEDFKRKGLKLFITYKLHDGMSTCMAGKMVTLNSAAIAKEDNR